MQSSDSPFEDFVIKRKSAATRDYTLKAFNHAFDELSVKEDDHQKVGLNALYLLMKSNSISTLEEILGETETPQTVKLLICNFLIEGRYFESQSIIEKTLTTMYTKSQTAWHAESETKQKT